MVKVARQTEGQMMNVNPQSSKSRGCERKD